jgi:hypothetical protein
MLSPLIHCIFNASCAYFLLCKRFTCKIFCISFATANFAFLCNSRIFSRSRNASALMRIFDGIISISWSELRIFTGGQTKVTTLPHLTLEVPNSNKVSCSNSSLLECSPLTQAARVQSPAQTCLQCCGTVTIFYGSGSGSDF